MSKIRGSIQKQIELLSKITGIHWQAYIKIKSGTPTSTRLCMSIPVYTLNQSKSQSTLPPETRGASCPGCSQKTNRRCWSQRLVQGECWQRTLFQGSKNTKSMNEAVIATDDAPHRITSLLSLQVNNSACNSAGNCLITSEDSNIFQPFCQPGSKH